MSVCVCVGPSPAPFRLVNDTRIAPPHRCVVVVVAVQRVKDSALKKAVPNP